MPVLETLWEIVVFVFWAFVFFGVLIALFSVIRDLFRDSKLNGWLKALWVVFLIFVPFLTTLIYIIFRGRGMAERAASEQQVAKQTFDDYVQSVAQVSPTDEIARAKDLLDSGAISADEFETLKRQALARA